MKRILIIDDDEEMCAEMEEILHEEGYETFKAYDGVQGVKAIEDARYDLAILDLKLPKLNGYDVLKTIRNQGNHLKVLVLSGRPLSDPLVKETSNYNQDEEAILQMANAVLNKPFRIEDLLETIQKLLGTKNGK
jgi:two-component system OmpR family response regulator